jgi:hypothetical protein
MARRPNYGQERAERQRSKAARRDARLAAKAGRRKGAAGDDGAAANGNGAAEAGAPGAPMPADPATMLRLGQALKFVCGAQHPTTLAVQQAALSGDGGDIERASALFGQLTPGNRRAALTIAAATPSAAR